MHTVVDNYIAQPTIKPNDTVYYADMAYTITEVNPQYKFFSTTEHANYDCLIEDKNIHRITST